MQASLSQFEPVKKALPATIDSTAAATATLPFTEFVWGAGLECSFIPHLNVDQFDWTQHNRFWQIGSGSREGRTRDFVSPICAAVAQDRTFAGQL